MWVSQGRLWPPVPWDGGSLRWKGESEQSPGGPESMSDQEEDNLKAKDGASGN